MKKLLSWSLCILFLSACGGGSGNSGSNARAPEESHEAVNTNDNAQDSNSDETLPNDASLSSLEVTSATIANLEPAFSSDQFDYTIEVPFLADRLFAFIPTTTETDTTLTLNGEAINVGEESSLQLESGENSLEIAAVAPDGENTSTYNLTVVKDSSGEFAQRAYVKPSNTDADDAFGFAVAVSGNTVVVGARHEDSNNGDGEDDNSASNAGAAYVFVRSADGTWSQQAYLKASNTDANDEFGYSVAISGDTIVIGSPYEDSSNSGVNGVPDNNFASSGAAYVFVRDTDGHWLQQAYLKASNADSGDKFGTSVAISGNTIIVGAASESSNATGINGDAAAQADNHALASGAAYIFVRDEGGNWTQQAYLKASDAHSEDYFGWSVAVDENTAAVSAIAKTVSVEGASIDFAGAAYIFVRDGAGTWSEQSHLQASNPNTDDQFGVSVALSGETLVVGANMEDSSATGVNGPDNNARPNSGAAYVFVRNGDTWSQQAYLKASNTETEDSFGASVAIFGNAIVVGAHNEDSNSLDVNGARDSGAAYLFIRDNSNNWSQQGFLKASNAEQWDNFGTGVDIDEDTVVIGAPNENSNAKGINVGAEAEANDAAQYSGAAYIFR